MNTIYNDHDLMMQADEGIMNTIYDVEGLKMQKDNDCVVLFIENIQRMEVTRREFEALIAAYHADK